MSPVKGCRPAKRLRTRIVGLGVTVVSFPGAGRTVRVDWYPRRGPCRVSIASMMRVWVALGVKYL